jgi:hypothetical protein
VKALKAIGYKGDVVIESFTTDVKVIARAAAIWRKIEPKRDDIGFFLIRPPAGLRSAGQAVAVALNFARSAPSVRLNLPTPMKHALLFLLV